MIGVVGAILRTPGWCRALAVGVRARVKLIAAGLLFTMGMYFLTTLPTRRGPRFTTLSLGSATSICNRVENQHTLKQNSTFPAIKLQDFVSVDLFCSNLISLFVDLVYTKDSCIKAVATNYNLIWI